MPSQPQFASDSRSVGIDVGGTAIKWVSMVGERVIADGRVKTPQLGTESVLEMLTDLVVDLGSDVEIVGLAVPGLVDVRTRSTVFIPNIPGDWDGFPIASRLSERTGRFVSVLNDARAFGHAELALGAGKGASDAAFFTLGTGVGGAVAKDGTILMSEVDATGELGHTIVEPDGSRCGCGGIGCLETVASASALVASLTRVVLTGLSPELALRTGGDPTALSAELITDAARAGDEWSLSALRRVGRAIGIAASNACVALHLDTVVIGGGLAEAFPFFAPAVDEVLLQRRSVIGPVVTHKARLGTAAGAIGAAIYSTLSAHNSFEPTTRGAVA